MGRADVALLGIVVLAGCAGPSPLPHADGPMFREPSLAPQVAIDAIAPGRSTRAEIAARLGDADRVAFDNGYEVWVYRSHPVRQGQPELVLLFGPDGTVKKVRLKEGSR